MSTRPEGGVWFLFYMRFGFSFGWGKAERGESGEGGSHMFSLYTTTVAQCSLNNTSVIHLRVGEERFH